mmetsp:Transcript_52115/g.93826  ORF Transcript_52115/g.93826 Transcript_52115/m.93826 type:complete len:223 (+) Transcript_52115:702-1370(+)
MRDVGACSFLDAAFRHEAIARSFEGCWPFHLHVGAANMQTVVIDLGDVGYRRRRRHARRYVLHWHLDVEMLRIGTAIHPVPPNDGSPQDLDAHTGVIQELHFLFVASKGLCHPSVPHSQELVHKTPASNLCKRDLEHTVRGLSKTSLAYSQGLIPALQLLQSCSLSGVAFGKTWHQLDAAVGVLQRLLCRVAKLQISSATVAEAKVLVRLQIQGASVSLYRR